MRSPDDGIRLDLLLTSVLGNCKKRPLGVTLPNARGKAARMMEVDLLRVVVLEHGHLCTEKGTLGHLVPARPYRSRVQVQGSSARDLLHLEPLEGASEFKATLYRTKSDI